jgi:hypothetical protein
MGLIGGNNICQTRANAGTVTSPLQKSWKAFVSTSFTDVSTRIRWTGSNLMNTNGEVVKVSPSWTNLNTLSNAPKYYENGGLADGQAYAWTASDYTGTYTGNFEDCSGWTSNNNGTLGRWGYPTYLDPRWAELGGSTTCEQLFRLYCISN